MPINKISLCLYVNIIVGLPTIFHSFAENIPTEERSRAFGYLIAAGSVGQTVASIVSVFCLSSFG